MSSPIKALTRALYNGRNPRPGDMASHLVEVVEAASAHLVALGPCGEIRDPDVLVCGDPDCTYCGLVAAFESVVERR